jgi:hypothetical protein
MGKACLVLDATDVLACAIATAQRAIRIRLLDNTYIIRSVNTELFVKDLLRYVTGQLSLRETAYFGLATLRDGA